MALVGIDRWHSFAPVVTVGTGRWHWQGVVAGSSGRRYLCALMRQNCLFHWGSMSLTEQPVSAFFFYSRCDHEEKKKITKLCFDHVISCHWLIADHMDRAPYSDP